MRANIPEYEMLSPKTLTEALAKLKAEPGIWKPFAGGTDLMVLFEAGKLAHKRFINIWGLGDLKKSQETSQHLTLGALTTYSDLQKHPIIQKEFPILVHSSFETGAVAIQNRGTLGGNIANASPAADSSPGLLVYDADIQLISEEGSRWVKYRQFHTGYKKTVMRVDELIHAVRLPRATLGAQHYFKKVGTRKAQAISKVCFAAVAWMEELKSEGSSFKSKIKQLRIALGSVGPTVLACPKTEAFLTGKDLSAQKSGWLEQARKIFISEIAPIDDIRSNAEYRLEVSANLLEDFLGTLQ